MSYRRANVKPFPKSAFFFALIALVLGGCASAPGTRAGTAAEPEVRAIERWNFLIAGQAEKAYDYMTPGRRGAETREAYAQRMNNRPVRWQEAILMRKECEQPDSCRVILQLNIAVPMPGMGGTTPSLSFAQEAWVRAKDGQWYYLGPAKPKDSE